MQFFLTIYDWICMEDLCNLRMQVDRDGDFINIFL